MPNLAYYTAKSAFCPLGSAQVFWWFWGVDRRVAKAAHRYRPEPEVIARGELVVDSVDQALCRRGPILRAMQVPIDTSCGAGDGDAPRELGRAAVEEWWIVDHHDDWLHTSRQLPRRGQRPVEHAQFAL